LAIPGNLLSSTAETIDPNTSGWAPKANASLSMGIGGRTGGGGCLLVKSIAAGEAQARTFASYPVTAGTLYEAFADTSGVVPERIGIRWLNQAGTEISITWSLLTMAASSSWHRVAVAGTAPAGTVFAQVILSSTETTAGANHFWENIYLGLPIRTVGNLLPFTTESTEVDASGWMAEVNATISRQVPVVTWSVTNYTAGGHTLAMTATAAGNAAAVAVDRPGVTPGSEYITYAYLQPPTLTSVVWLELRFYDANGNQVGASHAQLAQPGTGFYRQILSGTAPASAATCGVAAGTAACRGHRPALHQRIVRAEHRRLDEDGRRGDDRPLDAMGRGGLGRELLAGRVVGDGGLVDGAVAGRTGAGRAGPELAGPGRHPGQCGRMVVRHRQDPLV
jgi:hypothetical protein